MLLFRSEEEAARWCQEQKRPFGGLLSLPRLQRLAGLWYGDRLRPDWTPRTIAESQAILHRVGLTSDFWRLA